MKEVKANCRRKRHRIENSGQGNNSRETSPCLETFQFPCLKMLNFTIELLNENYKELQPKTLKEESTVWTEKVIRWHSGRDSRPNHVKTKHLHGGKQAKLCSKQRGWAIRWRNTGMVAPVTHPPVPVGSWQESLRSRRERSAFTRATRFCLSSPGYATVESGYLKTGNVSAPAGLPVGVCPALQHSPHTEQLTGLSRFPRQSLVRVRR